MYNVGWFQWSFNYSETSLDPGHSEGLGPTGGHEEATVIPDRDRSHKIIICKAQGVPQKYNAAHSKNPGEEETSPNIAITRLRPDILLLSKDEEAACATGADSAMEG